MAKKQELLPQSQQHYKDCLCRHVSERRSPRKKKKQDYFHRTKYNFYLK